MTFDVQPDYELEASMADSFDISVPFSTRILFFYVYVMISRVVEVFKHFIGLPFK